MAKVRGKAVYAIPLSGDADALTAEVMEQRSVII